MRSRARSHKAEINTKTTDERDEIKSEKSQGQDQHQDHRCEG